VTRRLPSLLSVLFVLLATFAQPQPAHADDAAVFSEALEHFHAGRFEQAMPMFRDIVAVTASPNVHLYYARSLRELGKLARAHEHMQQTVREATAKAKTEERYVATRDAAASELAELEARVGKVIVVLVGDAPNSAATLNGVELRSDQIAKPVAVMPGSVAIVANAPGSQAVERTLTVAAGTTETVTLSLAAAASTSPDPAQGPSDTDEGDDDVPTTGGEIRMAGFAVAGLGVAGMVMFGVSKALADAKFDSVNEDCGQTRCTDPAFADEIDDGKTLDTLTNVGLIVGIAGLAGGAAMIIFGGPSEVEDGATAWSFRVRSA